MWRLEYVGAQDLYIRLAEFDVLQDALETMAKCIRLNLAKPDQFVVIRCE